MSKHYFKEGSKGEWNREVSALNPVTYEELKLGAILRIADATEKMASNYDKIQNELDMYKRWHKESADKINKLEKSISAYRGHIKRLKSKLK